MAMVGLEQIKAARDKAQKDLLRVRNIRTDVEEKIRRLDPDQLKSDFRAKETARLREDGKREADAFLKTEDTYATIERHLALRPHWERRSFVRRARFTPAVTLATPGQPFTSDDFARRQTKTLADLLESTEALRWTTAASRMLVDELRATFEDAVAAQNFALLGVVVREAAFRSKQPGARIDDRALAAEFLQKLEALDLPELAEAETIFIDLENAKTWIDSAARAILTGDDMGARAEQALALQRQGVTHLHLRRDGFLEPAPSNPKPSLDVVA